VQTMSCIMAAILVPKKIWEVVNKSSLVHKNWIGEYRWLIEMDG
jgi:hypothetical protein